MSCTHNWIRLEVSQVSVHGKPMEPMTSALVPVSICSDCYLTHISFGYLHLIGVLRHEQENGKL